MFIASVRLKKKARASRSCAAPFRCRLVIMAKAPVAGAVKTRLAREVGVATATRFARQCCAALIARVGFDPRWETSLWVTPDAACSSRHWPGGLVRMPQGPGDLGKRMQRILDRAPPGPVVIIGTDIPGVRRSHIAEAFRVLGRRAYVFAPATDGGYWLIGSRRRPHAAQGLFSRVRWSSEHALADTLANLDGRSAGFVAKLSDVDDAATLARYGDFGRRVPTGYPRFHHTA
jgi:rSAM/selenodomain-associated transferase 1